MRRLVGNMFEPVAVATEDDYEAISEVREKSEELAQLIMDKCLTAGLSLSR